MSEIQEYGIVYVLSNPAMPNIVKIGMTTREDINLRMQELYNTSVPVPFVCEYACKVFTCDCAIIEKALHIAFSPYRLNPSREFFEIEPEQAIAILKLLDRSEDITTEVATEAENSLSAIDKEATRKINSRRPVLNFSEMNIPINSKLEFAMEDIVAEVTVCSDRRVLYEGEERSLTSVTQELLGLNRSVRPTRYWLYNGRNVGDIYTETYGERGE